MPDSMTLLSAFANSEDGHLQRIKLGEGLVGQCALEKRRMLIANLPLQTTSCSFWPLRIGAPQRHCAAGAV